MYISQIVGDFTLNSAEGFAGSKFQVNCQQKSFFTTLNLWPSRWSSFGIYFCHYLFQTYCDVIVMVESEELLWKQGCQFHFICNILSCLIKGRGILKKVLLAVNLTLLAARAVCTTVNLWPSHHSDFFWEKKHNRVNISITILSVFDTFLFVMVSVFKFWNWPIFFK